MWPFQRRQPAQSHTPDLTPVPPMTVESMARSLYRWTWQELRSWETLDPRMQEYWRMQARHVMSYMGLQS